MAEWLKAHAWKAKQATDVKELRRTLSRIDARTWLSKDITRCDSVSFGIGGRFSSHLTQFLHSSGFRLPWRRRASTYPNGRLTPFGDDHERRLNINRRLAQSVDHAEHECRSDGPLSVLGA